MISFEEVDEELRRIKALLSPRRTKLELSLVPPPWPPSGAILAFGLEARGEDLTAVVAICADGEAAAAAAMALRRKLESSRAHVVAGTNGRLMLAGTAPADSPAAHALSRMGSAFAGDE